jgi:CRISPR-associated protein (TIGR03984 family)
MPTKTLRQTQRHLTTGEFVQPTDLSAVAWLQTQATEYGLRWLLAYTHAGIVWGELRDTQLVLAPSDSSVTWSNLQQARLFGPTGELLLWPSAPALWRWRCYSDTDTIAEATLEGAAITAHDIALAQELVNHTANADSTSAIYEYQEAFYLLWGTHAQNPVNGFRKLIEGGQGIEHMPPLTQAPSETQRAKLRVRHYIAPNPDAGLLEVIDSRLVALVEAYS